MGFHHVRCYAQDRRMHGCHEGQSGRYRSVLQLACRSKRLQAAVVLLLLIPQAIAKDHKVTKEEFKQIMLHYLNIPYRWGGDDPMAGFDCSGLTQELQSILGIKPQGDHSASGLYNYWKNNGEMGAYDTGALAFYGTPGAISHVAVLFDAETILEAGSGRQTTTSLQAAIDQNAYTRLRSVNNRKDLVAVIKPNLLPW